MTFGFIIFSIPHKNRYFISLNYYQWWAVMTALSLLFVFNTIKKRNYNPHIFLFFFMAYYVFLFYGGLKFFYGFCLFQYAFTFLLKGEKGGKLKFILITLLAGGFHVMYYMFLVLALIHLTIKTEKYSRKIIIFFITVTALTLLNRKNFSQLYSSFN